MDQSWVASVAIAAVLAFTGAFYIYYTAEPSFCVATSPGRNPRTVLRAKTSRESCEASLCNDRVDNLLSHELSEIKRHKSLLAEPCICCDSFMYTNCHRLPNLASVYMGGEIASTRDTVPFVPPFSKCGLFGCTNDVNNIIKPEILLPGKNWRFAGQIGSVIIQLPVVTFISAISIIHPHKNELPKGFISSAPHEFSIYGLNSAHDKSPVHLGSYKYSVNGFPGQTFVVETGISGTAGYPIFQFIEINFRKNHGNSRYTAIYKVEVHGVPLVQPE